jgi:uncharacterized protein (TIGR04255 family)
MAEYRHLKNAPITEAVIDLRIKPPLGDEVLPKLSSIKDDIGEVYPVRETLRTFGGEFIFQEGKAVVQPPKDAVVEGFIYKTEDAQQIAQFRKNGFSFNRLKPYTSWEAVLMEAHRLWMIYLKKALPELVTRIAVRYINKMELSAPERDFSEYLIEPPRLADGIPAATSSFYYKAVVHDDKRNLSANVIQLMDAKAVDPQKFTLILDNDVYKTHDYEAGDPEIWEVFSQLRELKNTIFFASITESAARLFE